MTTRRALRLGLALALCASLLAACGDESGDDDTEGARAEAPSEATAAPSTSEPEARPADVEISVVDDRFTPATVEVGEGSSTVAIENTDEWEHTFTLDEAGVDVVLEPGDRREVALEAPAEGAVTFYCRFHRDVGMEGTLVLQDPTDDVEPTSPTTATTETPTESDPDGYGGYGY